MMFLMGKSDEHGTQHREDVSLNEGHQQLQEVHEEEHEDAEGVQAETESDTHRPTEEDHAGETEHHGMACHHVGKETDHQGEGFREDTEKFDERHHWRGIGLQEQRHLRPEDLLPVLLVGEDVDGQHCTQGQEEGDVDVTRHVGTTWEYRDQSDEVTRQDEEEHRQQIGCIRPVMLLSYRRHDQVVVDRHHDHLHETNETTRGSILHVVLLIPAGTAEEDDDEHGHHNPDLQHALRDTQVKGTNLFAAYLLIDLTVMLFAEEELFGQTVSGAEEPLLSWIITRTTDDDRQRDAQVLALIGGDVPLIRVGQVLEDDLRDVDLLAFTTLFRQDWHRQQCYHHQEDYRLYLFHYSLICISKLYVLG